MSTLDTVMSEVYGGGVFTSHLVMSEVCGDDVSMLDAVMFKVYCGGVSTADAALTEV